MNIINAITLQEMVKNEALAGKIELKFEGVEDDEEICKEIIANNKVLPEKNPI
jgi:hypothetical protein